MWLTVGGAHVGGRGYEGGCGYKDRRDHLSRMGPRVGVAVMGGATEVVLSSHLLSSSSGKERDLVALGFSILSPLLYVYFRPALTHLSPFM